ncbi:MAG: M3 family metallopeptidase [Proteobacteria bacterium]|nr:M3 family metallopeptidase [Pseudomonadota bacterium]
MKRSVVVSVIAALSICGCAGSSNTPKTAADEQPVQEVTQNTQNMLDPGNPFAEKSTLPYGIIDFSKLKSEHFKPALEAGMAQQLAEIDAIANQTEEPTFENTFVALEKSGDLLMRTETVFFGFTNSRTDDVIKAVENEMAPKLAAHQDAIMLNDKLFKRVEKLYQERASLNLDPESLRLLEVYYQEFVRAGAKLTPEQKAEVSKMNAEIATLETEFGQNILNEMNDSAVVVESVEELDGLSEAQIKIAAEAAKGRGMEGKYLITLQNTSIQPILKSLKNRDLRKKVHEASLARGSRGGAGDNRAKALRLATLRAKRAEMLGYPNFAAYAVEDQMAKTVDNVNKMLYDLVPPAKASMEREAAELQKLIDEQKGGFKLEAYDWLFYSEQLRKKKYELDDEALKPYFELDNVIQKGVFYAAEKLYGIRFVERNDIPKYDPDIRIFEVFDADDKPIALFVGDYYARDSKRGGAWMSDYVYQSRLKNERPVVENQINITKPPAGEKTLLTFDEVTTLFHEFGHALHGMFSNVQYPRFSGTNVPRDFVEFPSQFNESWAVWPEILENYAVHYQTGEKIPQELLNKVIESGKFNQGYMTTEYLSASILDQHWHQMSSAELSSLSVDNFEAIEKGLLDKAGLAIDLVPPRYRTTYFNHIFANGYSAGYYAYIWSEVLDADAAQWFKEHGLSRENGDNLRRNVLQNGFSIEPMTQYRNFAGRDPSTDPLLIRRGLK